MKGREQDKLQMELKKLQKLKEFKPTIQSCREEERSGLLQFKGSFIINRSASNSDDAYPKVLQWKLADGRNGNCCAWDGIVCDERTGHVIGLDLSSSGLLGSINSNSSLFRLVQLQVLNLAENNFSSSRIPTSIRNFPGLIYLNLSLNHLTGPIPSQISQLAKLSSLDLSSNQLTGPIPSLGNLTHLTELYLSSNQLTGPIPSLGNLTRLTALSLSSNQLTGPIPSLENLIHLTNQLTGPIPSLGNLTHLTKLFLSSNQLTSPIPNSLSNLINLEALDLANNNLIETESTNASPTSKVKLSRIGFVQHKKVPNGFLPEIYTSTSSLRLIDVSHNQLRGELPRSLGNCTTLEFIDLSYNKFSDVFPIWLRALPELKLLAMHHNAFYGLIEEPDQDNVEYFPEQVSSQNIFSGNVMRGVTRNQSKYMKVDTGSFEFDWKFVLAGLGSGLVVGVVLSDVVITKKHEWFVEIVKTIKLMIGDS
ncbi:unnamed protein product [Malus baccata var. baccata]